MFGFGSRIQTDGVRLRVQYIPMHNYKLPRQSYPAGVERESMTTYGSVEGRVVWSLCLVTFICYVFLEVTHHTRLEFR